MFLRTTNNLPAGRHGEQRTTPTNWKNKPIGIFDSGIGGLTVAKEIIKKLPNEDIIYFGDTARFPYGNKSVEQIKAFVFEITQFLDDLGVKLIVIACNSASSAGLIFAQEKFDIPIVGVVEPGARAAAIETINRRVGIIGTEATINSGAYKKAIRLFDAGIKAFGQACPMFANFVEDGQVKGEHPEVVARQYLSPLIDMHIDTLILGCTHYPLLEGLISKVMGDGVRLISSAEETALEVKEILKRKKQLKKDGVPNYRFISSGDENKFLEIGRRFLGKELKTVERVTLG